MFLGSGRSKRRLAKAAGAEPSGHMRDKQLHAIVARSTFRSQNWARKTVRFGAVLEVEMSKKLTSLWQETHLEVKEVQAHHSWSTFGSCAVEKVHAIVAGSTFRTQNCEKLWDLERFWKLRCRKSGHRCGRSTFGSQNGKGIPFLEHFRKLRCWKSARRCGKKHILKSKLWTTVRFGALLEVEMWFWVASAGQKKVCKTWGFCSRFKSVGRRGVGRRSTRDTWVRLVWRCGRWFPERGCILEHQIFKSAERILRNRCSTSYELASLFRGRGNTSDKWNGKIAKHIDTRRSALQAAFYFWRKSRRIASFFGVVNKLWKLMISHRISSFLRLSSSKIPGILAEVLGFWCCPLKILGKSCRIASFLQRQKKERWMDGWMDR